MGIAKDIFSDHKKIGLDTNLFIYAFEQNKNYGEKAKTILNEIKDGNIKAISSIITLTEILTKPLHERNEVLKKQYKLLLTHFPNLTIVPIDAEIAERAAYLRVKYGLKTADALILSSAIQSSATLFITNDQRLTQVTEISTLSIGDF